MRGVSGIFFDHLNTPSKLGAFEFIKALGFELTSIYEKFITPNLHIPYTPEQREFQLIRRSRYVEFNLVYDRGTKFGLQSGGRIESILMSLPSVAHWKYNWQPAPNSPEEKLITVYLKPQDWVNLTGDEEFLKLPSK